MPDIEMHRGMLYIKWPTTDTSKSIVSKMREPASQRTGRYSLYLCRGASRQLS
jgi:hypothetical protein